jgi:hypothetical protein
MVRWRRERDSGHEARTGRGVKGVEEAREGERVSCLAARSERFESTRTKQCQTYLDHINEFAVACHVMIKLLISLGVIVSTTYLTIQVQYTRTT